MKRIVPRLQLAIAGLLLIGLGSCRAPTIPQRSDRPFSSPDPASPSPAINQPASAPAQSPATIPSIQRPTPTPASDTTTVTIYTIDRQCEALIPQQVQVTVNNSMEAAVGKVIEQQTNADFELAGYRVNLDSTGVATIDLRLAPNSPRQIVSLSTCEQFALFGSLRETLLKNPQWQVKSVRFTERGNLVEF